MQDFEWRRIFQWSYADTLSGYPSNICTSVSDDDRSSEYSSDSDDVSIRPPKRQKTLVIDSGMESQNETHHAGEDFVGASGVTIECDDWHTINEVTINFWLARIQIASHRCHVSAKFPWSVMS